jgi:hypothetical protein
LTHQPIPLRDWIRERLRGFELRQKQRDEARRAKNLAIADRKVWKLT